MAQKKTFKKFQNILKKNKIKNPTVLFSPAAASFDQFDNFEDRGKYFNKLIKKINFIKKIYGKQKFLFQILQLVEKY